MTRSELDAEQIVNLITRCKKINEKSILAELKLSKRAFNHARPLFRRKCYRIGDFWYLFDEKEQEKIWGTISSNTPKIDPHPSTPTSPTNWVGGNPFDSLRAVHSCSSADVAWARK